MIKDIKRRLLFLKGQSTLKEFAEKLDLPTSTVYYYLNGGREPSLSFLLKVSEKLNVREEWLLTGTGKIFKDTEEKTLTIDQIIEFLRKNWDQWSQEKRKCFESHLLQIFPEFETWLKSDCLER